MSLKTDLRTTQVAKVLIEVSVSLPNGIGAKAGACVVATRQQGK